MCLQKKMYNEQLQFHTYNNSYGKDLDSYKLKMHINCKCYKNAKSSSQTKNNAELLGEY